MRAKVIKKPERKVEYYGKVGTVIWRQQGAGVKLVTLKFDDGSTDVFFEHELRMGVKASD